MPSDTIKIVKIQMWLHKGLDFMMLQLGASDNVNIETDNQNLLLQLFNPYLSVLDFLKSLFHKIDFLTWFFVYFKLDFYCLCSLQKSSSK